MAEDRDNLIKSSVLRNALRAGMGEPKSPCPDPNLIAAFLEDQLKPAERRGLEEHAAACARCQELLSVSIALEAPSDPLALAGQEDSSSRRLLFRFSFPVSSLALLIVAGIAIYVLLESRLDSKKEPAREFARLEQPAGQPRGDLPGQAREELEARIVKSPPEVASLRKSTAGTEGAPTPPPPRSNLVDRVVDSNATAPQKPVDEDRKSAAVEGDAESVRQQLGLKQRSPEEERAELRVTENAGRLDNAKERKAESPSLSVTQPAAATAFRAATASEPTPEQVLMALSEVPAGSGGSEKRGKADAPAGARAGALSISSDTRVQNAQRVGSKTFVRLFDFWVDLQCREHAQDEVIELAADDERLAEIQRGLPQLERLRSSKLPVLIRWRDKNYLIR